MTRPFVLLDDVRGGRLRLFADPRGVVAAWAPGEVPAALKALNDAIEHGLHAAGYFAYELGYALEPKLGYLMPHQRSLPLLWFGLFGAPTSMNASEADGWFDSSMAGRAYRGPLRFAETDDSYAAKFRRIQDFIRAGDVYQVNFTFPARFAFAGDPLALYRNLRDRAAAAHCAYVFDGERALASLSPESFFSLEQGIVRSRPMKGTAPRGVDEPEDARLKSELAASPKDRAENLMIVDLIRNDLGRVARTGSVKVGELYAVETYPTVHQMVSTVSAELREGITPSDLLAAMFPCGSVTGAPKIRAMEIIRELETTPRGVYCGAIGRFSPGGSADFNVAIRTMTILGNEGTLAVGSGVVADSDVRSEYRECLTKARYYLAERPPLSLIETLRHEPGTGFVRGSLHLARIARSAAAFGIVFDDAAARQAMAAAVKGMDRPSRVRLELAEDGTMQVDVEPFVAAPMGGWTYAVSARSVRSGDMLARHKTSWRKLFDEELTRLRAATGCDQVIFLNERGEVVEANATNVFLRRGGRLLTPPLSSGALDGVLRQELLRSGGCVESVLTLADLESGAVFLGNSLRGLVRAGPAKPRG